MQDKQAVIVRDVPAPTAAAKHGLQLWYWIGNPDQSGKYTASVVGSNQDLVDVRNQMSERGFRGTFNITEDTKSQ